MKESVIYMGNQKRYVVKHNDISLLLSPKQSQLFESLINDKEKSNFIKTLNEAKKKPFRVTFRFGEEEHKRVIRAYDEKDAVMSIHAQGGNVLSIELLSDQEAKRRPKTVIGEMFNYLEKFKNFK